MKENYLIPIVHFDERIMAKGEGSFLYDTKGNKYLDLNSGQFCTIFGHANKELTEQISKTMNQLSHTASNILSEPVIECAKNINRISGEMNAYSILLSTGAEAVEFCIRYAKHIKGKNGIVCYDRGYHGLTLGAQSLTYSGQFAMPRVQEVYPIKIPDTFIKEESLDCHIEELNKLLKEQNSHIAAVLMEPIISVGGMIIPPEKWYKKVQQLCDEYDVLLIFDESQTGFGRLGKWFAYQHYDVVPDMVAIAKGLGQGYPVSGVLFNEKIIPRQGFSMTHYSSHQNDAFAANIINIGIEYIERNSLLSKVMELGEYFKSKLLLLEEKNKIVCKARGCGLMLGLDLYFDGVKNYREIYKHLSGRMTDKGVIIQGTNAGMTLRFLPDYLISKQNIDLAINTLDEVLKTEEWEKYI